MKYLLIIIFLLLSFDIFSQYAKVDKIEINFNFDADRGRELFLQNSDTSNYYMIVGERFNGDTIQISQNDTIIFKNALQTDFALGLAEKIAFKDISKRIAIKLNGMHEIEIPIVKGKYYIYMYYSFNTKTLAFYYSKLAFKLY